MSSASPSERSASSMPDCARRSEAMRRICPAQRPTFRSMRGKSFGPITTRATITTTTSSEKLKPNTEVEGYHGWSVRRCSARHCRMRPLPPLQGLLPEEVAHALPELTLAEARRIVAQVHRDEAVSTPSSTIRRTSREVITRVANVPALEIVSERKSRLDPFVKYALKTHDGHVI